MKIILRQPVEKLGQPGDIVSVKSGYARNFLIPQGLAYPAEGGYLKRYEQEKKKLAQINLKLIKDAEELKARLEQEVLTYAVKVDEEDKLYGSVNAHEIMVTLAERGLELERKQLGLDHPLKELGEAMVPIKLHTNVTAEVRVNVVREGGAPEEAEEVDVEETLLTEVGEVIDEETDADETEAVAEETAEVEEAVPAEEVASEESVVSEEAAPEAVETAEEADEAASDEEEAASEDAEEKK